MLESDALVPRLFTLVALKDRLASQGLPLSHPTDETRYPGTFIVCTNRSLNRYKQEICWSLLSPARVWRGGSRLPFSSSSLHLRTVWWSGTRTGGQDAYSSSQFPTVYRSTVRSNRITSPELQNQSKWNLEGNVIRYVIARGMPIRCNWRECRRRWVKPPSRAWRNLINEFYFWKIDFPMNENWNNNWLRFIGMIRWRFLFQFIFFFFFLVCFPYACDWGRGKWIWKSIRGSLSNFVETVPRRSKDDSEPRENLAVLRATWRLRNGATKRPSLTEMAILHGQSPPNDWCYADQP